MLRYYAPLESYYERDSKKRNPILNFRGDFRFLSNFFMRDLYLRVSDTCTIQFRSGEHAFMWHKSRNRNYRQQIMNAVSPAEAKRLGNNDRLTALGLLRDDWRDDLVRIRVMYKVLKAKYQDPQLLLWLHRTEKRFLCEGNHWNDVFWGECNGKGENHLGRLSMVVRHENLNSKLLKG